MLEQDPGERMPRAERAGVAAAEQRLQPSALVDPEWVEAQLSRLDLLLRALVEPAALGRLLLAELAPLVGAAGGAVYTVDAQREEARVEAAGAGDTGGQLVLSATDGVYGSAPAGVSLGEGFVGACAVEQRKLVVRDVPAEHFRLRLAPASALPKHCVLVPVWLGEVSLAVLELAFTEEPSPSAEALLDRLSERRALGQGAAPTASGSESAAPRRPSYRYGFWGKLSHELRSPLNSVLVLSQLLAENAEANLSPKQIAFAKAIHASGSDLLALVNAISDLSKIETNRLVLEPIEMSFEHFRAHLQRAFEPLATERGLELSIELAAGLPEVIVTDATRVRQILGCLLSNAFKFTESGRVSVSVALTAEGWSPQHQRLNDAREVVAFAVSDTGVGLTESEQRSILEVFPPERIEARRGPGASGLGLAISRELARLLGGDLRVTSAVGAGSTFTLYLPLSGAPLGSPLHAASAPAIIGEGRQAASLGSAPAGEARGPEATLARNAEPEPGSAPPSESSAPDGVERAAYAASSLPAPEPSSHSRSQQSGSAPPELAGLDVMLVDDDVRSAFSLTGILERQGVSVSHAEGIAEALQRQAEGRRICAFLIDAELLATGSDELVRRLLSRCAELPIIALTRSASGEEPSGGAVRARPSALPPEVQALERPVEPAALVTVLRTAAARARAHAQARHSHRDDRDAADQ